MGNGIDESRACRISWRLVWNRKHLPLVSQAWMQNLCDEAPYERNCVCSGNRPRTWQSRFRLTLLMVVRIEMDTLATTLSTRTSQYSGTLPCWLRLQPNFGTNCDTNVVVRSSHGKHTQHKGHVANPWPNARLGSRTPNHGWTFVKDNLYYVWVSLVYRDFQLCEILGRICRQILQKRRVSNNVLPHCCMAEKYKASL